MKSANYSIMKTLLVILTLIFGATINSTNSLADGTHCAGPTSGSSGAGCHNHEAGRAHSAAYSPETPRTSTTNTDLDPTCSPGVWNSMVVTATAKAQRRTVIAQSLITKPDKTEAMTCLAESLLRAAAKIGSIFTDNPQFSGGCDFGGGMISTMLNTLMALETAENLGGGILDGTNRDDIINSILSGLVGQFLTNFVSGWVSGAISGFIGGCLGTIVGDALGAVITSIGDQLTEAACNNMNTVWQGIAMQRVDNKYFMTARQLANSDPRYDVAGVPPDAFFTALISDAILDKVNGQEIFGEAIDVSMDDIYEGSTFQQIAEDHFERLAPATSQATCHELPVLGPFISCNRGCVVTGTLPNLTCTYAP